MPPTSCCSTKPIFRATGKGSPTITTAATCGPALSASRPHGRAGGTSWSIWEGGLAESRPQARSSAGLCREGGTLAARKKTEEQVVRVAPLGELRAYTISEHELERLEQGGPVSDLF